MTDASDISRLVDQDTVLNQQMIPPIPRVPFPPDVIKRVPGLDQWYNTWHKAMEDWRMKSNMALRGAPY